MASAPTRSTVPSVDHANLHRDDVVQHLPAPENKKFYPALDGLRAIAVLMVFCQHYVAGQHLATRWGWTGVDIFFVLSGFLITGILYDTRNAPQRVRNFYIRRTLRIFPLYYGVLLLGLSLEPFFRWQWHPAWFLWPFYLGNYARFIWLSDYRSGVGAMEHLHSTISFRHPFYLYFGHFWSLCVEEQFYLFWPPLVFLVRDRIRLRNLCLSICVVCLAARTACFCLLPSSYIQAEIVYRLTPLRADALMLGGAIALMLRGPEAARLKSLVPRAALLFLVAFAIFEVVYAYSARHAFYPTGGNPILGTLGYTLIDLFAGIVILFSLNTATFLYRVLTVRPLRRLGQVSYGFYVFHDIPHSLYAAIVAHTIARYTPSNPDNWTAILAFFGTLALSFLSFRFFESPFLRLKQRFAPA